MSNNILKFLLFFFFLLLLMMGKAVMSREHYSYDTSLFLSVAPGDNFVLTALPEVHVFIHTWFDRSSLPLALGILDEMFTALSSSEAMHSCCNVHVHVCVGASTFSRHVHYIKSLVSLYDDLSVSIVDVSQLGTYEWATLRYIEMFVSDPSHEDCYILYMHSKGTSLTKSQLDREIIGTWREYFHYFLIKNANVCLEAMMSHGYRTCGVDKNRVGELYDNDGKPFELNVTMYSGNYWWATSEWLGSRCLVIAEEVAISTSEGILRTIETRSLKALAEAYLLWDINPEESKRFHYCIFHSYHDW